MELKELLKLLKEKRKIFFVVCFGVIFLSLGWLLVKKTQYQASMALHIARNEVSQAEQYQYDQYYRLLADEKFADTIVRWADDPQIARKIFSDAEIEIKGNNLGNFSKLIKAEKLSPNFIRFSFSAKNKENAEKIALSVEKNFVEKNNLLNQNSQDKNWFMLVFDKAIIIEHRINPFLVLVISAIAGAFLGFFSVLFHHYWKE